FELLRGALFSCRSMTLPLVLRIAAREVCTWPSSDDRDGSKKNGKVRSRRLRIWRKRRNKRQIQHSRYNRYGNSDSIGRRGTSGRRRLLPGDERQRQSLLVLVLALLVGVARLTRRVAAEEQDLGYPLPGVDLGRQGRRVADLDRDLPFPLRLQGGHV